VVIVWVFFPWNWAVTNRLPDGTDEEDLAMKVGKAFPYQNIGSEFMPPLYEGDLLYMPTTFPGISPTKARELLQQTDKIIRSFPKCITSLGRLAAPKPRPTPRPST
jgi:Cu(I)/Ag(I) efflux system membrane protein CusA/SilA